VGHPGDPGHDAPPTAGTHVDEALGGAETNLEPATATDRPAAAN
jgi:hypothetical protein